MCIRDSPDTATSLWWMGVLNEQDGEKDKARALYSRALTIYEKRLGPDHPNTQSVRQYLSRVS